MEEMTALATTIVDRLILVSDGHLSKEEVLAVNSMKNQVEIVVTDLMVLHGADEISVPDVLALEGLLQKMADQSLRLL
ncbi:Uncharacterized protein AC499_1326 [Pseudomonas amygdali pv. lachrymans]|uniref:Uncharacterized protein n=1 Tax=Pseudomonas amygdali pv. lachrymans TaxID=53707 RepID=A0ABR5KQT7_PSEAV|nr:Uncharacterized protein AC499_0367 [Pseudomonas amygdali pv. lachrymans]KPC18124.1 Uncharacterized protein AC499_1326 [Pseudomonas amygdali pv. lachrymans]